MKKYFDVHVTVRRMGRKCPSCTQRATGVYLALSAEDAIRQAKEVINVDESIYQIAINYVREQKQC